MNYTRLKWIAVPLAMLSTISWIAADARAFFGCCQRKMDAAAAMYAGTGPCAGPRVVSYVPQTCYRVQYVQQAVTTYKPVCGTDPCTGCPVTTMKPVVCYRPAAQLVPYNTYRLVYSALQPACPTTATTYYAPLAGCPSTCATGACGACGTSACGTRASGVTAAYAAPATFAAPAAAAPITTVAPTTVAPTTVAPSGCSSCGAAPALGTYSSGYAPAATASPGYTPPPGYTVAPGYSSGARLGVPQSSPAFTYSSPSTPATTFAPGSTNLGQTVPGTTNPQAAAVGGSTTVYSYNNGAPYGTTTVGPTYSAPAAGTSIVNSTPGAATIGGPSSIANPSSIAGPSSVGTSIPNPYSSSQSSGGAYSSGTSMFAPSLTTTAGPASASSSTPPAGDGMTSIPSSTFMLPPMRGSAPTPSAAPTPTMPVMPTPMPGASPTPSRPAMAPIPDPELSPTSIPAGPALGRPAATTPVLIDPKDQTAFAWPTRRAWSYAPISGRIPAITASYTTIDGEPTRAAQTAAAEPSSAATNVAPTYSSAAPTRLEAPVRAGDGWTRSAVGGGWTSSGS